MMCINNLSELMDSELIVCDAILNLCEKLNIKQGVLLMLFCHHDVSICNCNTIYTVWF